MYFNKCIHHDNVLFLPKNASIMPLFNKGYRGSVEKMKNYCVSILTLFIGQFVSKYQCGYRKGFNAQHCLLGMLEKQKRSVDKRKVIGEP